MIDPILRTPQAANDSVLLAVLMAVLAVNLLLSPTLIRAVRVFFKQLFRTHREVMPGEKTFGERIVVLGGVVETLVFEALLLYCAVGADIFPPLLSLAGLGLLTLLMFMIQYCGYALTGYAFAGGDDTRLWLSAFLVTQACAGLPMAAISLAALFYPRFLAVFLILGFAFYIIVRIPLYIREFRIFYISQASILYFFLYLCTLEIVPFIGVLAFANLFSTLFC